MLVTPDLQKLLDSPYLTKSEVQQLLDANAPEADKRLAESYVRLVFRLASFYAAQADEEDLVSAGNEAVLVAIQRFERTKGAEFLSTWVQRYVRGYQQNVQRSNRGWEKSKAAMAEALGDAEPVTSLSGVEAALILEQAHSAGVIDALDLQVLRLHGLEGHTQAQTADLLGVSRTSVNARWNAALARIAEEA
jgi:RNA polymerase sigma-70 factor (ECF subfamily)